MLVVVADTSPLRYLAEIGHIEILPQLFEKTIIPRAVYEELRHPSTQAAAREWAARLPSWIEISTARPPEDPALTLLDAGEKAALELGETLRADFILIDDRKGVAAAVKRGFQVTGTLGILVRAAQRDLLDLAEAFERLRLTNFRYRPELMAALLREHRK